jgi:hypothetical protein
MENLMKRFWFLTLVALVLLFLSACPTRAAEITIDWRQKLDSGLVDDLKFMPGQEQFILSSGQVQFFTEIRSCEDGRVLKSYPFGGRQIEFTPDSTKVILMCRSTDIMGELQLRNLNDMNLLASYKLQKEEGLPFSYFDRIAVDPIRPFLYAIRTIRDNNVGGITKMKIFIYDIETLQNVGELTTDADSSLKFAEIAISNDGRYLVAMNYGISKLIVWSLDTRQKVVDKIISDPNSDKSSSTADIKFSGLNTDKVFFTGQFYQSAGKETLEGLCIFSISENRIIDSTFALPTNSFGWNPEICLFENETKVIGTSDGILKILDLYNKRIEFSREVTPKNELAVGSINYNEKSKFFIGGSYLVDKFRYQTNTNVPTENPKEVIYPNPTTGIVNIPLNCINSGKYEIYNTNGRLLSSSEITSTVNNLLTIDFTQYPSGVYSVKVYCGKSVLNYQVVRVE